MRNEISFKRKMTPRQWVENFWYYYKWMFLTAIVFIAFIIIASVQFFTKVSPDANILYVGNMKISNFQADNIRNSISSVMRGDYNGNGKRSVELETINIFTVFDKNSLKGEMLPGQSDTLSEYNNQLLAGDGAILLLDSYFFYELKEDGVLISLEEVLGYIPEGAEDDFGIKLGKLNISKLPGFSELPQETYLCIRFPKASSMFDSSEGEGLYNLNSRVFCDIIEYSHNG